jgi:hypothetical protein
MDLGRGSLRNASPEGRSRSVLREELHHLCVSLASQRYRQGQSKVDSCRHSCACQSIAVAHHTRVLGRGAKRSEHVTNQPMRGCPIPIKKPGCAEQKRARAHTRDPIRTASPAADEVDRRRVLHRLECSGGPPRYTQDGEVLCASFEGRGREDRHARVGHYRSKTRSHQLDLCPDQIDEDVMRAHDVEQRKTRVEEKRDCLGVTSGTRDLHEFFQMVSRPHLCCCPGVSSDDRHTTGEGTCPTEYHAAPTEVGPPLQWRIAHCVQVNRGRAAPPASAAPCRTEAHGGLRRGCSATIRIPDQRQLEFPVLSEG